MTVGVLTFNVGQLFLDADGSIIESVQDPTVSIIENGAGVTYANSYASLANAQAYFIGRRLYSSAWNVAVDADKEQALRQASALLDSEFTWSGQTRVSKTQGLAWPFIDAFDRYGATVVGVPKQVQDATCELALWLLSQERLTDPAGVGLKSLKIDVIELEFDKTEMPRAFPPHVARMLIGLGFPVKSSGTVHNVRLYRV